MLIGKINDKIKAIPAFSPGEYYTGRDIETEIKDLNKPTFIMTTLSDTKDLSILISKIITENLIHYKPREEVIHCSRVLWKSAKGSQDYRKTFIF